jgi:hypothetical protein
LVVVEGDMEGSAGPGEEVCKLELFENCFCSHAFSGFRWEFVAKVDFGEKRVDTNVTGLGGTCKFFDLRDEIYSYIHRSLRGDATFHATVTPNLSQRFYMKPSITLSVVSRMPVIHHYDSRNCRGRL